MEKHPVHRDEKLTQTMLVRLNKIEGQVKGIKKMIENEVYCDDVLTQIAATQAALKGVSKLLLENHLQNCLPNRIKEDDLTVIDEVMKTIERIIK